MSQLHLNGREDYKINNPNIEALLNPNYCNLKTLIFSTDNSTSLIPLIKKYLISDASKNLENLIIISGSNALNIETIIEGLIDGKCCNLLMIRIGGMKNPDVVYELLSKALMTQKYKKLNELTISGSSINPNTLHNLLKPLILGYCPFLKIIDFGGYSEDNCYNEFIPYFQSKHCNYLETIYVSGDEGFSSISITPLLASFKFGQLHNLKSIFFFGCALENNSLLLLWDAFNNSLCKNLEKLQFMSII